MAKRNWLHSMSVAAGIFALLTAAAVAAPPSDDDAAKILSPLIAASIELGMQNDVGAAR